MPAGQLNAAKTHCPQGHEYTSDNTAIRIYNGTEHRWCRECNKANGRIQRFKKYNLTPESFQELLDSQDNVCAICHNPFKTSRDINVDHDHNCCPANMSCGECIRGILCGECNRGLARFHDSAELLKAAYSYLTEKV